MQICKNCGREVKYIASGYDKTFVCEPDEKDVVSENGWLHKAYTLHDCGRKPHEVDNYNNEKGKETE